MAAPHINSFIKIITFIRILLKRKSLTLIINLNFKIMAFELPQLPYSYDALEPHIDARTMEIHHTKHHNAYTTNLNAAIAGTDMEGKTIENILLNLDMKNAAVRNNGGGFYWFGNWNNFGFVAATI